MQSAKTFDSRVGVAYVPRDVSPTNENVQWSTGPLQVNSWPTAGLGQLNLLVPTGIKND